MTKTSENTQRFLGGVATTDLTAAEVEAFRTSGTDFATALNGLDELLDEPQRAQFLAIKEQLNRALAGLPATDQAPAALEGAYLLRQVMSMFRTVQDATARITDLVKSSKAENTTLRASIPTEVSTAIADRVKAGDLFEKTAHEEAITKARANERSLFSAEIKTISDRRSLVTAAGVQVPSDEALAGEDADFTAKLNRAKDRSGKLTGLTLASAQIVELAWNESDERFTSIHGMLLANKPNKPATGPNAFAAGTKGASATSSYTV